MQKPKLIALLSLAGLIVLAGIFWFRSGSQDQVTVVPPSTPELPVNTIPVESRPYLTLTPDSTGRYLTLGINSLQSTSTLEYELVYATLEGDQGAFGRINLETDQQPIAKLLLLGSKSAGGAVTYYPGVSGGYVSLTYDELKLKEPFNFIRFDPASPEISTQDGRVAYQLTRDAYKKDTVVVTMKTSGFPAPLPAGTKLVAGPYAILAPSTPKGKATLTIKLPAGEFESPTVYEYVQGSWVKLASTLQSDSLTATPTSTLPSHTLVVVSN